MKAEDVKVGMVVYDKRRLRYFRVKKVIEGMALLYPSDPNHAIPVAFSRNIRPLTKREKGD